MSERYSRVYTLPGALYAADTPVIIAAGALLKDNVTGNILAQLKFQNITPKKVKALRVQIACFDAFGTPAGEMIKFQYLELNAGQGETFGQKVPIPVADQNTRSIQPRISDVVFADDSSVSLVDASWLPIPAQKTLEEELGAELVAQYKHDFSADAKFAPVSLDGLWLCGCGCVNQARESCCYACHTEKAKQISGLDRELLLKNKQMQELARETARKNAVLADGKAKMAIGTVEGYEAAIGLFASIPGWEDADDQIPLCQAGIEKVKTENEIARKDNIYAVAVIYMTQTVKRIADMEAAITEFQKIPGWKDADEKIAICRQLLEELKAKEEAARQERERTAELARIEAQKQAKRKKITAVIATIAVLAVIAFLVVLTRVIIPNGKYNDAVALMNAGKYQEAISAFEEIADYRDSEALIAACTNAVKEGTYADAVALMNAGEYRKAEEMFAAVGDYKDAKYMVKECIYQQAVAYRNEKNWVAANALFEKILAHRDSAQLIHHHEYKIVDSVEPTCTTSGYITYRCSCEDGYTKDLPVSDHSYTAATCTSAKKCSYCGKTDGVALGHTTERAVCSRCGITLFETMTYSGRGEKTIENITLPTGKFKVSINVSTGGKGGAFDIWLFGDLTCKHVSSNETDCFEFVVSGPIKNGTIRIAGGGSKNASWEITIEVYDPNDHNDSAVSGKVVIYNVSSDSYITNAGNVFNARVVLEISPRKNNAIAFTVVDNGDGTVSFLADDGGYLYCDGTNIGFCTCKCEYAKYVLEKADGGYYIRCATANYKGNPQYLDIYQGYLSCYGIYSDSDLSLYTFKLERVD